MKFGKITEIQKKMKSKKEKIIEILEESGVQTTGKDDLYYTLCAKELSKIATHIEALDSEDAEDYQLKEVRRNPEPERGFYGEIYHLLRKGWKIVGFTESGNRQAYTICYLQKSPTPERKPEQISESISARIKQLESQLREPEIVDQKRVQCKLEAYRELALMHSTQPPKPLSEGRIEEMWDKYRNTNTPHSSISGTMTNSQFKAAIKELNEG